LAEQALKMFYRIREFGCKPTVKIYNHVLDALLSENRFQMINPIYSNMKRDGMEPNVFTYNILLKASV
jgi:pentatricopeptide repeat protein